MRVCIFNHYAAGPDEPAGTRHYDLAVRMRPLGIETSIYASSFSHFSGRDDRLHGARLWRSEELDGVTFTWVRTPPYAGSGARRAANMLAYAALATIAQGRYPTPDVFVGSSVHPFAAVGAYIAARARHRPFVYEVRDLWPQTLIDMGVMSANEPPARLLYAIESRLVSRAHAVVSLLPDISAYFESRSLTPRRLAYVPNGIQLEAGELPHVPGKLGQVIDAWGADGAVIFGYVGTHGPANDLGVLLDAMHEVRRTGNRRIRLVLVGGGPEKAELIARKVREGLDAVTFFDPVPKTHVPSVLGAIDVGMFHLRDNPVFRYGISSNKLFDYMAAGLPVIFACRSGYDPIALAGAGRSVAPGDAAAIAAAMGELAAMPAEQRGALGDAGRAYVYREHNLDPLAERFAGVLREVVRGRGDEG